MSDKRLFSAPSDAARSATAPHHFAGVADGGDLPPPHLDRQPSLRVLAQFRQLFNVVKQHFSAVEDRSGVSGAQVWAMHCIDAHPGLSVMGLARLMRVHQPTASAMVKALGRAGLLRIERSEADRRVVQLYLTPLGRERLERAPGPPEGVLPEALARLDIQDQLALERSLAVLIAHLGIERELGLAPLGESASPSRQTGDRPS